MLREANGRPLEKDEMAYHEASVGKVPGAMGDDAFAAARADGQAMSIEQANAYALGNGSV